MGLNESVVIEKLKQANLRPTRQRLIIGGVLWQGESRHVTAEQLHTECKDSGAPVSMATVYNTLHQFVDSGLLKEVVVDSGSSYFDTNTKRHHHFYYENTGKLQDIDAELIDIPSIPTPDSGKVKSIEVIIRVSGDSPAAVT